MFHGPSHVEKRMLWQRWWRLWVCILLLVIVVSCANEGDDPQIAGSQPSPSPLTPPWRGRPANLARAGVTAPYKAVAPTMAALPKLAAKARSYVWMGL